MSGDGKIASAFRIGPGALVAAPSNDVARFVSGAIYSWAEVSRVHRTRNGIYHRNGSIISLLTDFGRINPCYPDAHSRNGTIVYTGNGRRGDQKLDPPNRALLDAVGTDAAVPLFNKLAAGRWEFTGCWKMIDGNYVFDDDAVRMLWKFTLARAECDQPCFDARGSRG